ncbi:MAG: sodium:solute symporter family protein [Puniceicoccales bacterium]|jgi:SSS family solute:Na+ symporter|nr:sodium:solute symporter family protein [Puniceicoccales bacterium]
MHWIDSIIIVAFLGVTLWIGFASGHGIQSFKEYATGNRNFSDFAIFCTVTATAIGGSATIGVVGRFYDVGIVHILAPLGLPIAFMIMAFLIMPRMKKYYGCNSVGDIVEISYGLPGKYIIGVVSFILMLLASLAQIEAMGLVINKLISIPYIQSVLLSSIILFIYTGKGGIKAVTFTDVLQFIILAVAIPLIFGVGIQKLGGFEHFVQTMPSECWRVTPEGLKRYLPLFFVFSLPTLAPMFIQRLLSTRTVRQGVCAFTSAGLFYFFLIFFLIGIGVLAKILYPNLINADQAVPMLVRDLMPTGIKGFVLAGFLAILMSTADSSLNAASIVLANDLLFPHFGNLSEKQKLNFVRSLTYMLGLVCILVALSYNILFEIEVIYNTLSLSTSLIPLYFCVFNRKINVRHCFKCIIIGLTVTILWQYFLKPIFNIDGTFPGFLAHLVCFTFFYFKDGRQKIFQNIQNEGLFQTLSNETRQRKPQSDYNTNTQQNILLGIFLLVVQIFPILFMQMPPASMKVGFTLINGSTAILLIFSNQFPNFYKKYFVIVKSLALFLCLPVTSIYLIFFAENGCLHIANFGLSILLINLLNEERSLKISLFLSIVMTILVACSCFLSGQPFTSPTQIHGFHLLYIIGFSTVLLAIWVRRNSCIVKNMSARFIMHDLTAPLLIQRMIMSKNPSDSWSHKEKSLLLRSMNEAAHIIDSIAIRHPVLNEENLNILIEHAIEQEQFVYKSLKIDFKASQTFKLRVDPFLFQRVVKNLIHTCIPALPDEPQAMLTIRLFENANQQISLTLGDGLISTKLDRIIQTQIDDSKSYNIGIHFQELQKIVFRWQAKLSILEQTKGISICQIQFEPTSQN